MNNCCLPSTNSPKHGDYLSFSLSLPGLCLTLSALPIEILFSPSNKQIIFVGLSIVSSTS